MSRTLKTLLKGLIWIAVFSIGAVVLGLWAGSR